jgi:hypothetical protein
MAGKKGRSDRSKTPAALAGHRLNGLIDVARRRANADAP